MDETSKFWKKVRMVWNEKIDQSKIVKVTPNSGGNMLFARLFGLADDYRNGKLDKFEKIETIIEEHIE